MNVDFIFDSKKRVLIGLHLPAVALAYYFYTEESQIALVVSLVYIAAVNLLLELSWRANRHIEQEEDERKERREKYKVWIIEDLFEIQDSTVGSLVMVLIFSVIIAYPVLTALSGYVILTSKADLYLTILFYGQYLFITKFLASTILTTEPVQLSLEAVKEHKEGN